MKNMGTGTGIFPAAEKMKDSISTVHYLRKKDSSKIRSRFRA
jgi:hypothetical protein